MRYSLLEEWISEDDRERVVRNLMALRAQLDAEVPPKNVESDLLLATWNIRDLGKPKTQRRGWGERAPESHFYIAEVLSRFDFIAVQEVNELPEWEKVTTIMGWSWDWIATDVTEGTGGNGERLTYLYDRRKVGFRNIAGEVVLPGNLLITANVEPKPGDQEIIEKEVESEGTVGKQFRRTPFTAIFQSAWFKFEICTVHIYYGTESGNPLKERIAEIRRIVEFLGKRAERAIAEGRSVIVLGDMNIVSRKHKTMEALLSTGFEVPPPLRTTPPTNAKEDKFYDQIAFRTRAGDLRYLETEEEGAEARAGVLPIFKSVYRPDQFEEFRSQVEESGNANLEENEKDLEAYYLDWRTYQFSDHYPLWVRLKVNDSENYLKRLAGDD
ncbi:MAG TPA: endonuclease/exonuclease/phosphatase family protein [Solirubrobacterales bacterium]|nr:endonuclease/exonuclease/phosphatase family protein [Solirubrobacterales bacterium]